MGLSRLDRIRLTYGWNMSWEDMRVYGFFAGRDVGEAVNYLAYPTYKEVVRPALNDPASYILTENKWVFYRLAFSFGIPIPRTFGLYDPTFGVTSTGESFRTPEQVLQELRRHRPSALVIKPNGGRQGYGLRILNEVDYDAGTGVTPAGREVELDTALKELPRIAVQGYCGYIIQERLAQHDFLRDLSPYTPNTIRVTTMLTAAGTVESYLANVRLGRRGATVDNWSQGGISVALDVATGRLGRGYTKPQFGGEWLESHPDTGRQFVGLELPMWDQVLRVCQRGARIIPGVRLLGWDVLLTNEGPVVLETNAAWDLRMNQVHTRGYLALPGIREELRRHGVDIPERLPGWVPTSRAFLRRRLAKWSAKLNPPRLLSSRKDREPA